MALELPDREFDGKLARSDRKPAPNVSGFWYLQSHERSGDHPLGARFAVDASRRSDLADLEFETQPPAVRLRDFNPRDHQRLVVNPFLFVFALIMVVKGLRWSVASTLLHLVALLTLALPLLPLLVQFHCLDCGQTGRYTRHDKHACPNVVARWNAGRSARFAWASQQLIYWCWILGSIGLLLAVLSLE